MTDAVALAEMILADTRDRRQRLEGYLADARADEVDAAAALQRLRASDPQAESRPAVRPPLRNPNLASEIDIANKISLVKTLLSQATLARMQLEREQPGEGSLRDAWASGLEAARMREIEIEAVLAKTWKEKTQWEKQLNKLILGTPR